MKGFTITLLMLMAAFAYADDVKPNQPKLDNGTGLLQECCWTGGWTGYCSCTPSPNPQCSQNAYHCKGPGALRDENQTDWMSRVNRSLDVDFGQWLKPKATTAKIEGLIH